MSSHTEVKIYDKPKKVCKALAQEIIHFLIDSKQPRFDIALSGGSTPKKLFKILASQYSTAIPWYRVHFWWGDERCVSPDEEDSNFKMANDILFSRINIPQENIHRIKGESIPVDEKLRYASEIEENLNSRNNIPVFDLILLGLGEDGHTASIFPGQLELFEDNNVCAISEHPVSGQVRITLTGKVLNNASRIFFLVTGEKKSMRISEIMNDDDAAKLLPAYYISPKNGDLIWFVDEAAASKIS